MGSVIEPPVSGPSSQDVENAADWAVLVAKSSERISGSADKWRDGLAALVSLITGGLIIAGPDGADLPLGWRIAAVLLTIGGLACAAYGFVTALNISAGGDSQVRDLAKVESEYGSVKLFIAAQAAQHLEPLARVRRLAIGAMALLLLGAAVWMVAPKAEQPSAPKVTVKVGDKTYCGDLKSADNGNVVIKVVGEQDARTIPFGQVTNMSVGEKC